MRFFARIYCTYNKSSRTNVAVKPYACDSSTLVGIHTYLQTRTYTQIYLHKKLYKLAEHCLPQNIK